MIMNMKKQLWSLTCTLLPCTGFTLTSVGAYLISLQTEYGYSWTALPAYIMIVCGFLAALVGVSWGICHCMNSKMHQRGGHERHTQVYTIERPSYFPPSYEESQGSQEHSVTAPEFVIVVEGVDVAMTLAPPLYSQDSSEAPNCMWSWERPPRYSQVERIQQGEVYAEERREALSGH